MITVAGGKFTGISRPSWSADGSDLSYVKYTEDGHYLYATEIAIVNMTDFETTIIASVSGNSWLSCAWAPIGNTLAIVEDGRLLLWEPGQ